MSKWISSLQAVQRLRKADPGAPVATLGLWAEEGLLRSRATRGEFSFGEDALEYIFSDDLPTDPTHPERWPAIPSYFWNCVNSKNGNNAAQYQTGIFATAVVPEAEIGSGHETDHIKLYGVSFHSGDLGALLDVGPSTEALAGPPKERWQQQRVSPEQYGAVKFIDIAMKNPLRDPLGPVALHSAYLKWHADPKNRQTDEPLKRSAFRKWQKRYVDGWRVDDRLRWMHTH
jgi:hypothetical protein